MKHGEQIVSVRSERGVIQHKGVNAGKSRLGVDIELFLPDEYKPKVLVIAGQHGDEPETTALLSSAFRSVRPEYMRAAVILALNPDGILRGTRGNANGVDLNRNFPVPNWGSGEIVYRWTSGEPRDVILSAGASPGSEPETEALMQVIRQLEPEYVVSIHAPLACVDDPHGTPLGTWLAAKTGLEHVSDVGYPTPGSFGTWAKERQLKVVTWELPHKSIQELRVQFDPIIMDLLTMEELPV